MDLTDKTQLLEYLKKNGIWARKGLSQNFLVDRKALDKIVKAAEIGKNDLVFEIGPGPGVLTNELVKCQARVIAVELDTKLSELLKSRIQEIRVINQDVLKLNIPSLVDEMNYKVVANIPYAITSKIIKLFLTQNNKPSMLVMLVQKEVAERICARPGDMSVLAVSVQAYGSPEIVDIVPAESFFPAPKVDSAILKIRIKNNESQIKKEEERGFFRCVKIGFSSKRKKLINNLSAGYHLNRNIVSDIMKKSGLSEGVRAEDLSIEEWLKLSKMDWELEFGNMNQTLTNS